MTQVSPFLKPDKSTTSASSSAKDDESVERNALNQPRLPVAGFWRRLGAVLFDLIVLYVAARVAGSLFTKPLLSLGHWSSLVGTAFMALYFALGNGPVGKGRTVGKLLAGIRTTTCDGKVPGIAQGLIRFALLYCGIIYAAIVIPLLERPATFSVWYSVQWAIPLMTLFAMLVANIFAVVFNPFKQTLHDHAARTLVRPVTAPNLPLEEIGAIVGGNWRRYYRQPQVTGWATFILVTGSLVLMATWSEVPESFARKYELEQSLLADDWYQGVHLEGVVAPTEDDKASYETQMVWLEDLYDETSDRTLHMRLEMRRPGGWNPGDPTLEERMQELARRYHQELTATLPPQSFARDSREGVPAQGLRTRPLIYDVVLAESISLGFPSFVFSEEVARFEFPMPPLEVRPVVEGEDEAETGSEESGALEEERAAAES